MNVQSKVKKAKSLILEGNKLLAEAQKECTHENLSGEFKSNTGNWCPSDNSYWVDLVCNDCEMRWYIDSGDQEYRKYSRENYEQGYGRMIYKDRK